MVKVMTPSGVREVAEGAPFTETIKDVARDVGLTHYRVFLGDQEIEDPEAAPAVIEPGMVITIYPYNKAG